MTLAKSDQFMVKVLTNSQSLDDVEAEFVEDKKEIHVASGDATAVSFWIQSVKIGTITLDVKAQTTVAADGLRRSLLVEVSMKRL